MIRFYLDSSADKFQSEIIYTLKLWSKNQHQPIEFTSEPSNAAIVGISPQHTIRIHPDFYQQRSSIGTRGPLLNVDDNQSDYLASAFYLSNSLQEFEAPDLDELNRFRYKQSSQHEFGNVKENLVQHCFDEIAKELGLDPIREKTTFFLSHDIDTVYGAIIEDGFNVLKKGRIDLFIKMLFNVAIARPDWLNMGKIINLESEYDCKSIFFWLVNKGKINERESNSDYLFNSRQIQSQFRSVSQRDFENGIHKSLAKESFLQEFAKYGSKPLYNRYHYLKFNIPQAYHDIAEAGLKLDASLGFADEAGFRNSYGLPFNPFNFSAGRAFAFVEAPLHVMDRTYFQYKGYTPAEAEKDILDFFEKNKTNCVLSVLWHNNFFTEYKFKGYLKLYKKILSYIKDNNLSTVSAKEIVEKYTIAS